jgi:2',5'-phosphodiesterase
VLCGDLNAEPHDGPVRYLREGVLSAGDDEWARGASFSWGGASSRAASRAAAAEADAAAPDAAAADAAAAAGAAAEAAAQGSRRGRLEALHGGRAAAAAAGALPGTAPARACALRAGATSAEDADEDVAGDDAEAPSRVYASLARHLRAGCTFKTCPCVAAFHLRRVAALPPALRLRPGSPAAAAALAALAALAARVRADGDDAVAEQAALAAAQSAAAAPPRDAHGFAAVPLGCGVALAHPFTLASGCGDPEWTNYVGGFAAVLDYVWFDATRLRALAAMPPPPLAAVTAATALPNAQFPSDHLPQCCDLAPC